jgi:hypothetical protein
MFDRNSFVAQLRSALADAPTETKADNAGPFRWQLTPSRNAQGLIVSVDLVPVARVNPEQLPEVLQ